MCISLFVSLTWYQLSNHRKSRTALALRKTRVSSISRDLLKRPLLQFSSQEELRKAARRNGELWAAITQASKLHRKWSMSSWATAENARRFFPCLHISVQRSGTDLISVVWVFFFSLFLPTCWLSSTDSFTWFGLSWCVLFNGTGNGIKENRLPRWRDWRRSPAGRRERDSRRWRNPVKIRNRWTCYSTYTTYLGEIQLCE